MDYYLVSLGCPKNEVDAEGMGVLLRQAGHRPVADPADADVLLVNTCGFIEPARAESLQVLNELARVKRPDQRLIATGCWAQREGAALARLVRGLDGILGTRRWADVLTVLEQLGQRRLVTLVGDPPAKGRVNVPRVSVQGHSAYLQIADGCSAPCAFCAIPLIKGPARSRPLEDIVSDARYLAERGVQEIVLIAQDTTAYGHDRGERDALPDLLAALVAAVRIPWLRLMYAHPQHVSHRLIETMASRPQICHYLDMPLQHAHPATLKHMRRPANVERVHRLIQDFRHAMPDIAIRTSFIVGYPGETEAEFRALETFVRQVRFDKVGVFVYSPERGTAAFDLPEPVPEELAQERYDRLMSLQQSISLARNQEQVGRVLDVLVEGFGEAEAEEPGQDNKPISVGRSYRDAPEIDGLVLIHGQVEVGEMVPVQIAGAIEYDLIGVI